MHQMQRLGEHLNAMAGQMKNAMERSKMMMQDQEWMRNREMERDMKRFREHMSDMTEQIEASVQFMNQPVHGANDKTCRVPDACDRT